MRLRTPVYKLDSGADACEDAAVISYRFLNGNEGSPSDDQLPDSIMGLGSNYVVNTERPLSSDGTMVEESPSNGNHIPGNVEVNDTSPVTSVKTTTSPVLRFRNKSTSRSERLSKGKSTSEMSGRTVRKTLSDALSVHKRPTSQFYDLEDTVFPETQEYSAVPNLLRLTTVNSGSQPALSAIEQFSTNPEGSSGLLSNYLSLRTSTPHLSAVDTLLQKFRKSFAFRFQRKKSEQVLHSTEINCDSNYNTDSVVSKITKIDNEALVDEPPKVEESPLKSPHPYQVDLNSPHKNMQKIILRVGRERKRCRRRSDGRMSLIYDSFDNILNDGSDLFDKSKIMPHLAGSDANILRKRAASSSDSSPKPKTVPRPLSVADSLPFENSTCLKPVENNHTLLRTVSDAAHVDDLAPKNLTGVDQLWRSNPVRLCRLHSRQVTCRKGRYRLRRSISQPIELEMIGSVHNLVDSVHGSADQDSFQKTSLSSDDDVSSDSDIYHSFCCSPTRRSNTCWELSGEGTLYAEALWDHETSDSEELPFQAGDLIEVTDTTDQEWWWGSRAGRGGWFPAVLVRLYMSPRSASVTLSGQPADGTQISYSPCKVSMNNLSSEQVRANIVQEIVVTERDYVKHLKDVVEGYLKQVHRRPDMFSKERIETVFGNIKEIYNFQSQFLKQLEECLNKESPHLSEIGNCFLNHKEDFKMYSEYCNNHPLAVSELQELYCDSQYIHFFEACRLLQEMIDISLDGFLLTPIQRICKYPLQLAELLKFTDSNHPDHLPVTKALAAMKEVAELVNERKRRMECLERLAEWQNTIEGWEGPDILDTSSILIHCGEVTRVSSSWSRDIYVFIFDHQLVYCKKDLLKRHNYAYKGRINLDFCDIVDIEDGKDSQFAVNVKNAWKIHCKDKDKWYLFYAKTSPEKDQWLQAFTAERQRVADDQEQGFEVTDDAKKAARLAVLNKQKPKRPRAKFNKGRRRHPDVAVTELLLDSPSAKSRSGSLPSNIHPEYAIMTGAKLAPTRKKGSGWFHFGSGKKPKS